MHRLCAWGLTAALLAGAAVAAEPAAPPQDAGFRRWNGLPQERPKPPTPPSATERAERRAKETAAALRAQEEANFLRRLAVCDRLRQLAVETADDALETQANVLQEKAEQVYRQKTSHFTAGKGLGDADTDRRAGPAVAKQEGKR